MEDGERIASLEATVKAHSEQFTDMKTEFARVHQSIASVRDHTDQGLENLRREHLRFTRWVISLGLSYAVLLLGIAGKVYGVV